MMGHLTRGVPRIFHLIYFLFDLFFIKVNRPVNDSFHKEVIIIIGMKSGLSATDIFRQRGLRTVSIRGIISLKIE